MAKTPQTTATHEQQRERLLKEHLYWRAFMKMSESTHDSHYSVFVYDSHCMPFY